MYTLKKDKNNISISKCIVYVGELSENEIEITEEQFNQMVDFPLKLTIVDGQVTAWEKIVLPVEEYVEPVKEPTIEERLAMAEDIINFLLGL